MSGQKRLLFIEPKNGCAAKNFTETGQLSNWMGNGHCPVITYSGGEVTALITPPPVRNDFSYKMLQGRKSFVTGLAPKIKNLHGQAPPRRAL